MKKPPAFLFYANDFLSGTFDMTDGEVGLYIRMLCVQWAKGSLPNDDAELARLSRCSTGVRPALTRVRAKFVVCEDGTLRNERLESERMKQIAFRETQSVKNPASKQARLNRAATQPQPGRPPKSNSPSPSPCTTTIQHAGAREAARMENLRDNPLTPELCRRVIQNFPKNSQTPNWKNSSATPIAKLGSRKINSQLVTAKSSTFSFATVDLRCSVLPRKQLTDGIQMNTKISSADASSSVPTTNADFGRRDFLKTIGMSALALTAAPWEAMAGPFTRKDFEKLVPADKKLRPEWVKSLFERGIRTVYRRKELDKIGMPVGGICAGQVYLGGDGRLWHWDIFNQHIGTGAEHYANPLKATAPFEQGFAIQIREAGKTRQFALNGSDWEDISFIGEYPIGYVTYRNSTQPVVVSLEVFSPFIPLNVDDSSLPATILEFAVKNTGGTEIEIELAGWLENAVCLHSGRNRDGLRRNRVVRRNGLLCLECAAEPAPESPAPTRSDIVFDAFEEETYVNWKAEGAAFGKGPVEIAKIPGYQGNVGGIGKRVVNSHASAPGDEVGNRDDAKGKITSKAFIIERRYITFLIGGGNHQGKTCMNLLVDGKVVASATGANDNRMKPLSWDVRSLEGKSASLQIVDDQAGGWGNIGVDDIVFSDRPRVPQGPLAEEADFGTLCLALLDAQPDDSGVTALPSEGVPAGIFSSSSAGSDQPAVKPFGQKLTGSIARKLKIAPGATGKVSFLITWHMPNLRMNKLPPGRYYAKRFASALAVAEYVSKERERLAAQTRLWHDTWYDSTLPYWFLDRTFLNTSILATATSHRFGNGRFYGWEGVGCCEGTCGHVWQYAHAVARLFPELERITREKVDFGLAQQSDGAIFFRGEHNNIPAIDAQAGTILRALREHQMTTGNDFLKRNWPGIKKAMDWLIGKDANGDGLIESNQHNTLDTDWFGPVAWLSGLYLSALLACETMAVDMNDADYAKKCRAIFDAGQKSILSLFDDGYFTNKVDPKHLDAINSGTGCHIDQVMGQSWAFQVGLGRVLPEKETRSALKALWKYNFTPDVGPYREAYKPGRWYAMPGEAGLLMCTFPRTDWDYPQARGKGEDWAAGYFNECMNGFEYQVAGHMIWEGMTLEGLAVTRAVHDRYHALRRNPWNEVECGDHYARSMASYGVFLAACGFEYDGPKGHIGFAPRLTPDEFRAPFTTAEAWGTYEQQFRKAPFKSLITVRMGNLRLHTLAMELGDSSINLAGLTVKLNGKGIKAVHALEERRLVITLETETVVSQGQTLEIAL